MTDPLDINVDLSNVDTTRPCLAAGAHLCRIGDAKVEQNKAQTGYNLVVPFQTIDSATSVKGDEIAAGHRITKWYPLQQSDNPKAPPFEVDIARLSDAALGTEQGSRPNLRELVSSISGREVIVKTKVGSLNDLPTEEIVGIYPAA